MKVIYMKATRIGATADFTATFLQVEHLFIIFVGKFQPQFFPIILAIKFTITMITFLASFWRHLS